MDQHETRTDDEGQEETQAISEPPQSAQPDDAATDQADKEVTITSKDANSEPPVNAGVQSTEASPEASLQVGPYIVDRSLGDEARHVYVAHEAEADGEQGAPPQLKLLVESAGADGDAVEHINSLGLSYPRLLTPLALTQSGEKTFLAFDLPADLTGDEVELVGASPRLGALDALKAGLGLADALAYLHRTGVVLQNVSPDSLYLLRRRAYLALPASAESVETSDEETAARFAQDVSALAQSLAALAEAPSEAPVEPMSAEESLRDVIARGTRGDFQTAEELQAACGAAVQLALHGVSSAMEAGATVRVAFRAGSATTVGRVRSQNQDASAIAMFDVVDDVAGDMPVGVFLVADGMGGEARGELASRLGARVVAGEMAQYFMLPSLQAATANPLGLAPNDTDDEATIDTQDVGLAQTLANAVAAANTSVRALAEAMGEATGSTITAVAMRGLQAAIAHLGDSRAYLLHGDTMVRMTEDHSLLARLEAMDHPLLHDPAFAVPRNFLYRSLGQEDEAPPDILEFRLQPGDRMMICSDGLWDEVDDKQIAQILAMSRDPETCAQALVRLANESGGHDNSTAVVVFVEETPPDSAASMERIEWQDIEPETEIEGEESDATGATDGEEAE